VNRGDILRVLVADDHEGFRLELRRTLERESDIQVVADESNGAHAVRRVRELRPHGLDLVLMDIDMPIMNGIQATAEILCIDPDLPVIILTVSTGDRDLFAGVRSGAVGFLNKNLSGATLIRTLRDFRTTGSLPMSRVMASKALQYLQHSQPVEPRPPSPELNNLSWREREILTRIACGAHDREIADSLFVAETTIKTHVRHILRKLGARNRTEAVARLRAGESG
jgi:DNA-binding NarL/FixJ family response regulator